MSRAVWAGFPDTIEGALEAVLANQRHFDQQLVTTGGRGAMDQGYLCRTLAEALRRGTCAISGLAFDPSGDRSYIPSFERLDNAKGYEPGNVIVVLSCINRARGDSDLDRLSAIPWDASWSRLAELGAK